MIKKHYVYLDYTNDFFPFYCGKGNLVRVNNKKRNRKHTSISKKYGFNREFIEVESEEFAFLLEIKMIADLKLNFNKYPENLLACNFTDGGEGVSGSVCSEETRKKMSKANIGKKLSDETRKKMSKAQIGRKKPLGRKCSDETRAKLSKAKIGNKNSLKYTDYEIDFIKFLRERGTTFKEISVIVKLSPRTIYGIIKNMKSENKGI